MTPAELHTLNRALLRVAEAAKVYLASDALSNCAMRDSAPWAGCSPTTQRRAPCGRLKSWRPSGTSWRLCREQVAYAETLF